MAVQPVSLHGKKILVTGPTSQVALPLLKQLCPIADVYALARFSRQKDIDKISALGAKIIRKDLATDSLADIPDDFDYALHFAVVKSGDFEYDLNANAIGSGRLLAHCKRAKAFLQCSTTGVYQYAGHNVLPENAALGDNHRALLPTYSICKIAQETVVRFAAQEHGVPLTIARLSVPYGDNGGWPYWHMVMMQNNAPVTVHPDQPNSYTPLHAEDYCRHIPYLLAAATPEATIVNWGGGQVVSIEEWCEWISELTGFKPTFDLQATAFGSLVADISKLQDILGNQPVSSIDWKDGILRMMRTMAPQHLKAEYAQEANTGS